MISFFDIFINIVEGFLILFFIKKYLRLNDNYNKYIGFTFIIFYSLFITILNIYVSYLDVESIFMVFYIILFAFFWKKYSNNSTIECLFLGFLIDLLSVIINYTIIIITSLFLFGELNLLLLSQWKGIYVITLFSKFIFFIVTYAIGSARKNYYFDLTRNEAILQLIFIVLFFLLALPVENYITTGYINEILFIFLIFMLFIVAMTFIFLFLYLIKKNDEMQIKSYKLLYMESVLSQKEESIKLERRLAKLRHDMKHILGGVLYNIEKDDIFEARKQLKEYINEIDKSKNYKTGNDLLDFILNRYFELSKEKEISFVCNIDKSCNINLKEAELGILLGNAIDNAFENCGGSKNILFSIKKFDQNNTLIKIENSIDEEFIDISNLKTSKAGPFHGFGINSMREIVEKNNGSIFFESEDYAFVCEIILNNNRSSQTVETHKKIF